MAGTWSATQNTHSMWQLIIKFIIAGTLVVAATEASKRSVVWGAVLVSLPLTSIIALGILWFDTRDVDQVSSLSWSILLIVLPSVVLFVVLPLLLRVGMPFWPALVAACGTMAGAYAGYVKLLEHFGIGE